MQSSECCHYVGLYIVDYNSMFYRKKSLKMEHNAMLPGIEGSGPTAAAGFSPCDRLRNNAIMLYLEL